MTADTQTLQDFRALFPGTRDQVYMDVAARGLISTPVRAAIDGYLDGRMTGGDKAAMFETVERARTRFGWLIGADGDEIAIVKNISDGVNSIAAALDWRPGDAVVLASSLEHPANIFPWRNLAETKGVRLESIQPETPGVMPVERLIEALRKPGVRVVAVSSVSFSPGGRTDLAALGAACRAADVLLVVDSAQSAGILKHDVAAEQIDVLAASTQKGLLGLYGMGFLYVRRTVAERLRPAYLSRMGVDLDGAHEAQTGDVDAFRLAPGARRFDVGNYNYIGAVAADAALDQLLTLGPEVIERHTVDLAARLRDGLRQLGHPVFQADDSHIVAIGGALSDLHDGAEEPGVLKLHERFEAEGVAHSIRRGIIRLSLHAYNDAGDVDRVLDLADGLA